MENDGIMEENFKLRIWQVVVYLIVIYFLIYGIGFFLSLILVLFTGSEIPNKEILSVGLFFAVMLFAISKLQKIYNFSINTDIRFSNLKVQRIIMIIALLLSFIPISFVLYYFSNLIFGHNELIYEMPKKIAQTEGIEGFGLAILLISILPALLEEALFRGVFQKGLINQYGPEFGITFAAVIFAVVHFDPARYLTILAFGFLLGFIYYKYQNLLYNFIMHFVNNAIAIFGLRFTLKWDMTPGQFWVFFICGSITFGILIFFIHKHKHEESSKPHPLSI